MGMLGSNGGLVGSRRVPSLAGTSGVWTPNEQVIARRAGLWPTAAAARYWRMDTFAATGLNDNKFDVTEIRFWDSGSLVSGGITCILNFALNFGVAASIVNGSSSTADRALRGNWSTYQATARLDFDFGQIRQLSHIEIRSLFTQPRFPASFLLSSSSVNGSGYSPVANVTVGTSFTSLGADVWTSGQVALS